MAVFEVGGEAQGQAEIQVAQNEREYRNWGLDEREYNNRGLDEREEEGKVVQVGRFLQF